MRPIAIIGIGCRFPGAENPAAFWKLLRSGSSAITEVPANRWSWSDVHASAAGQRGKTVSRWGGFLHQIDSFDADYFGITADEANALDPQQRLLMELAVETLNDAGIPGRSLGGSRTGVFIGISSSDYGHIQFQYPDQVDQYGLTGAALSIAANRISYCFDLRGPSLAVDTACSSSLAAVHLACVSLDRGESMFCLAGGVSLMLSPLVSIGYSQAHADSPDGVCRAFDAKANGVVRGEGAGLVLLRPLDEALAAGNRIYAVLRGTAMNQDGLTNGLAAPNPVGQRAVIQDACRAGRISASQVAFVEAHGTGTILGDPIEAGALGEVVGAGREQEPCLLGSVKTNIGHLEAAAGIAGLLKAVLSLHHHELPPSLNYESPNPRIRFEQLGLAVARSLTPLPERGVLAGVSSFGFGGTNVHAILEAAPAADDCTLPALGPAPYILPISAQSPGALTAAIRDLAAHTAGSDDPPLPALLSTLAQGRDHLRHRAGYVVRDRRDVSEALAVPDVTHPRRLQKHNQKLIFVCPGMGSQQPGMGYQLRDNAVFRETIAACDAAMAGMRKGSLLRTLDTFDPSAKEVPDDPDLVQPLMFALQVGLAAVWRDWGIRPDAVIGTSIGEVAAAVVAGVLSLEDGCTIVCRRIPILRPIIGQGGVAVTDLSAGELARILEEVPGQVWIAARNGPHLTGFSGDEPSLERVLGRLRADGRFCRRINGAVAPSHSPLMEPFRDEVLSALAGISPKESPIPLISTVTGTRASGREMDASYWWRNIRMPVELAAAIAHAETMMPAVYLELSPHPSLLPAIVDCTQASGRSVIALPSLKRGTADRASMLESLGSLYALGWDVNFHVVNGAGGQLTPLPPYPWQRRRFWIRAGAPSRILPLSIPPADSAPASPPVVSSTKREELLALPPAERHGHLLGVLTRHVARAIHKEVDDFDPQAPLKDLGVGSLVGMELYSRIRRDLGVSLPTSVILSGPSLVSIVDRILQELSSSTVSPGPEAASQLAGSAPLSFSQERIWVLEQLEPTRTLFIVPILVDVTGALDVQLLENCVQQIVQRHEILRTVFIQTDGEPRQVHRPEMRFSLDPVDVSNLNEVEGEGEIQARMRAEASTPFDLVNGPLFRLVVFRLSARRFKLGLISHHLITDGWSLGVWLRELGDLYAAGQRGDTDRRPALPLQYAQYAEWQRAQMDSGQFDKDLTYWERQLDRLPALVSLPGDHPRAPLQTFRGARVPVVVSSELTAALQALARRHDCTLFVVLLAAFKVLVHRLSGRTDLVVGTPVSGRHEPGVEGLLGVFVNMLALRSNLIDDPDFLSYLAHVRDITYAAFDHQEVPFEKVVDSVQPPRSLDRSPVFQLVLAVHAPLPPLAFADLALEPVDIDPGRSQYDLTVSLLPTADGLRGTVEYNADLYDVETIVRLSQYYRTLLAGIVETPGERIWKLPLVSGDGAPVPGQGPQRDVEDAVVPVHHQFEAHVAERPHQVAISDGHRTFTYAQFFELVERVGWALERHGLERGDPVAVWVDRTPEMMAAWVGILRAGGAFVPIDRTYPLARATWILRDSGAKVILLKAEDAGRLELPGECQAVADPWATVAPAGPRAERPPINGDDRAYILYTSGSTGTPKGVEVTHANLAHLVKWHRRAYEMTPADRASQLASPSFDASVWEIWPALATGASLVLVPDGVRTDPPVLAQWLIDHDITLSFVPTALSEELLEYKWPDTVRLRALLTGGDRLSRWPKRHLPFRLVNHYGPTECTVVTTCGDITEKPQGESPQIGRPIEGVRVYLLDHGGNPVSPGVAGEIAIAGQGVTRGYWGRPDLTGRSFIQHAQLGERLYLTGDLARQNAHGDLEFLGRSDSQVKLSGVRVEPGEVAGVAEAHPAVARALARAVVGPGGQPELALYLIPTSSLAESEQGAFCDMVRRYLGERLPATFMPAGYAVLDRFPVTGSGKLDPAQLPLPQRLDRSMELEAVAPRSAAEARMLALWAEVLGVARIGIHSSFFELGGRSLLAIRLVARIKAELGEDVPVQALFEHPTIAGLVAWIARSRQPSDDTSVDSIVHDSKGRYLPFPLTDVQQAYWVGRSHGFALSNVAARFYGEFAATGLDSRRLEQAMRILIDRHDMLRAVVLADGTQQVLAHVPPFTLQILDLSREDPQRARSRLARLTAALSHKQPLPSRWPLFDLSMTHLPDGQSRLHFGCDGLIADAWSLQILAEELSQLYRDPAVSLAPIAVTYRDYVLAVKAMEGTPGFKRSLDYWKERVQLLPEAPELPLARDPATIQEPRFHRKSGALDPATWTGLKRSFAQMGVTPSCGLLAVFAETLSRFCRHGAFTLNVTLFNRLPLHADVPHVIGDFTTLTLLAVDVDHGIPLRQRAVTLQRQLWADMGHRQVSGVRVLRELMRDKGWQAVGVPVVFTSALPEGEELSANSILGEPLVELTQTPQVWLDHQVMERGGRLVFHWDSPEGLYPEGLLEAMWTSYERRLVTLAANGNASLDSPPAVVSLHDRAQRDAANRTATTVAARRLHAPFLEQARRRPEATAVLSSSGSLSYGELEDASSRFAHHLAEIGVRPGDAVAIVVPKGPAQVVSALAVLRAGAAYVPVPHRHPERYIRDLLVRAKVSCAVVEVADERSLDWPVTRTIVETGGKRLAKELDLPEDALAYILFTSGSTGPPKGVMVEHRAAVNTVLDVASRHSLGPRDRVFALSELDFDLSVFDLFGTLAVGAALVMPEAASAREPAHWVSQMNRSGVTVWNSVPTLMRMLVEYMGDVAKRRPRELATILLSGDWVGVDLAARLRVLFPRASLTAMGGATEASIWSVQFPVTDVAPEWTSIPYGKPLANQTLYVLDQDLAERPTWVPGRIFIGGVGLARGYLDDPAGTAARFILHPRKQERLYDTGDLGRYLPDGNVEFLGRTDYQVKIQGHRVELGAIETALQTHPQIQAAVVVARGKVREEKQLVAYVQSMDEALSAPTLIAYLGERLAMSHVPQLIIFVREIPLTPAGKIDRKALPDPSPDGVTPAAAPPVDPQIERSIAGLIGEILKVDAVDPTADLLSLGANSVDIVRLANRLEATFGRSPPTTAIFRMRTVRDLALFYQADGDVSPEFRSDARVDLIIDPGEREAFKKQRLGLRRSRGAVLHLPGCTPATADASVDPSAVGSHRSFLSNPVELEQLGYLLAGLGETARPGGRGFRYPSAGGLYPVQVHVYVAPGGVTGAVDGTHYYDPVAHSLVTITPRARLEPSVHFFLNVRTFEQSRFSIFLIADMRAIEPVYGRSSRDYCLLEAGAQAQILRMRAPHCRLGLCSIAELDFPRVQHFFQLDEKQVLLHSLVGGVPDPGDEDWEEVRI